MKNTGYSISITGKKKQIYAFVSSPKRITLFFLFIFTSATI